MKRADIKELKRISSFQYENIFDVIKDENGDYFYNLYNTVDLGEISDGLYKEHSFSQGDYWTKLAHTYYGDANLWWIILITNNIQNPLNLPPFGTKLKILKDFVVTDILNQIINAS